MRALLQYINSITFPSSKHYKGRNQLIKSSPPPTVRKSRAKDYG